MGEMRIIDKTGDSVLAWSPEEAEEIREAEARFKELTQKGHVAFDVIAGGKSKKLTKFNPDAENIVVVPRLAGG